MAGNVKKVDRNPVAKVLDLLEWCVDESSESVGTREAAAALGIAPSSAHRLLNALVDKGYLLQDQDDGRYQLGPRLFRLAQAAGRRSPLPGVALGVMHDLVVACNETALLGIFSSAREEMTLVAAVDCSHELRFVLPLHTWLPLHSGASGLAILAFLPEQDRQRIISRSGIVDGRRLERELKTIRSQGYAVTHGQRTKGAVGMACPVFGPSGDVEGDLILNIPELRFSSGMEGRLARLLTEAAQEITVKLGGRASTA
jgi:IclR family transcriptional regulator, acetate operon repressor